MPGPTDPQLDPTRRDAVRTRARLLAVAANAFAERGFHQANLRDICAEAEVNLSAVGYYFGGKAGMYREILVESHRQLADAEPLPRLVEAPDPATALRRWIDYFLRLVLVRRPAHPFLGRIIRHELAQPTEALDDLVRLVMRPVRDELLRIVASLATPGTPPRTVKRLAHFTILLCVQHELARPVLDRFNDPAPKTNRQLEALAEQIHGFVLGGIERAL